MAKSIAFLGAGNMASAMVEGLLARKAAAPADLACFTPSGRSAALLAGKTGITQAASLPALLAQADILVVAFKPQHLAETEAQLGELTTDALVISVLAGKTLARLGQVFPRARNLVRCMPNTPGQIGAGITGWCSARKLATEDGRALEALLGALGRSLEVPESGMNALTGVSGSGPAYVFEFAGALRDAGIAAGLDAATAETLVVETLLGASLLLAHRQCPPEQLRDAVTSPNGTTFAGLQRLAAGNFRALIKDVVLAATARAEELSGIERMNDLDGRILVTGGAGFIGSALIWALNQRGRTDIIVTDFLGSGDKWRDLSGLKYADYCDAASFRIRVRQSPRSFGRFSAVFHLGACSSTTETNESYLADNNTAYSAEVAAWALAAGSRFIYASSAATYGDGTQGMDDCNPDLARLRPLNPYGNSKQLFDLHAQRAGWLDRIVGLKYFNVFGPNEGHKGDMRSLVNKAYEQIMAGGKVRLFQSHHPDCRDGEQKRDFLYVKDAVEMTLHFAEAGAKAGGLYNLGSGEAQSWLILARAIFAALDRKPAIEFIPMPEVLRGRYQYYTRADISRLRASGYRRPLTPLPEAVRDYVQNYLAPGKRLGD